MGLVKVVPPVHLVLEARLLPGWIARAVLRRGHPLHGAHTLREDKRLEDRPISAMEGVSGKREGETKTQGIHMPHTKICRDGERE